MSSSNPDNQVSAPAVKTAVEPAVQAVNVLDLPLSHPDFQVMLASSGKPIPTQTFFDYDLNDPTDPNSGRRKPAEGEVRRRNVNVSHSKQDWEMSVRFRSKQVAAYPFLSWRTQNTMPAITIDLDEADSLARITSPLVPTPSLIQYRADNGHVQACWNIDTVSRPKVDGTSPLGSPWALYEATYRMLAGLLSADTCFTRGKARNPWFDPTIHPEAVAEANLRRIQAWERRNAHLPEGERQPKPRTLVACTDGYVTWWAPARKDRMPRRLDQILAEAVSRINAHHPQVSSLEQAAGIVHRMMGKPAAPGFWSKIFNPSPEEADGPTYWRKTAPVRDENGNTVKQERIDEITCSISEGARNNALFNDIRHKAYAGWSRERLSAYAHQVNRDLMSPSLPEREVNDTVKSVYEWTQATFRAKQAKGGRSTSPAKQAAARTNVTKATAAAEQATKQRYTDIVVQLAAGVPVEDAAANSGYASRRVTAHLAAQLKAKTLPGHLAVKVKDRIQQRLRDGIQGTFWRDDTPHLWERLRDLGKRWDLPPWPIVAQAVDAATQTPAKTEIPVETLGQGSRVDSPSKSVGALGLEGPTGGRVRSSHPSTLHVTNPETACLDDAYASFFWGRALDWLLDDTSGPDVLADSPDWAPAWLREDSLLDVCSAADQAEGPPF